MRTRVAAFGLILLCGGAQAAELDIPWFMANPEARRAWQQRCQNDGRVANRHPGICRNADAAETRLNMGQPLSLDPQGFPVPAPPPAPPRPLPPLPRRTLRHAT